MASPPGVDGSPLRSNDELQQITVGTPQLHNPPIDLAECDSDRPRLFTREAVRLRDVLGDVALRVEQETVVHDRIDIWGCRFGRCVPRARDRAGGAGRTGPAAAVVALAGRRIRGHGRTTSARHRAGQILRGPAGPGRTIGSPAGEPA